MARLELPRVVLTRNPSQADLITAAKWGAIVAADDAQFVSTGREVLLLRNTTAGALTVTVSSTANAGFARAGTAPTVVVPANGFSIIGPIPQDGFITSIGTVNVSTTVDGILGCVLELPGSTYYSAN
jgi:hypothetical protein